MTRSSERSKRVLCADRAFAAWLVASAMALVVPGCAGPPPSTRPVQEGPEGYVRLESCEHNPAQTVRKFSHPLPLSEEDWARILRQISVQPQRRVLPSIGAGEARPMLAFDEKAQQFLARALREAFSKARSDEWVVFFLSHPRDERGDLRGGAEVTEVTSGGWFAEGGRLHLVLANYRFALTVRRALEQMRERPFRPVGEARYELVPSAHQTLQTDSGCVLMKSPRAQGPGLVVELQPFLSLYDGPPQPRQSSGSQGASSVEERLRILKRLREQGLITEEEYESKRQKLLDEL